MNQYMSLIESALNSVAEPVDHQIYLNLQNYFQSKTLDENDLLDTSKFKDCFEFTQRLSKNNSRFDSQASPIEKQEVADCAKLAHKNLFASLKQFLTGCTIFESIDDHSQEAENIFYKAFFDPNSVFDVKMLTTLEIFKINFLPINSTNYREKQFFEALNLARQDNDYKKLREIIDSSKINVLDRLPFTFRYIVYYLSNNYFDELMENISGRSNLLEIFSVVSMLPKEVIIKVLSRTNNQIVFYESLRALQDKVKINSLEEHEIIDASNAIAKFFSGNNKFHWKTFIEVFFRVPSRFPDVMFSAGYASHILGEEYYRLLLEEFPLDLNYSKMFADYFHGFLHCDDLSIKESFMLAVYKRWKKVYDAENKVNSSGQDLSITSFSEGVCTYFMYRSHSDYFKFLLEKIHSLKIIEEKWFVDKIEFQTEMEKILSQYFLAIYIYRYKIFIPPAAQIMDDLKYVYDGFVEKYRFDLTAPQLRMIDETKVICGY